jgi:hypothetical protein
MPSGEQYLHLRPVVNIFGRSPRELDVDRDNGSGIADVLVANVDLHSRLFGGAGQSGHDAVSPSKLIQ